MNVNIKFFLLPLLALTMQLNGCKQKDKAAEQSREEAVNSSVIEVVTELMDFQTVDTIMSGWNTFRYINRSNEVHFFLMDKYPAGKTLKEGNPEVIQVFQRGMDLINNGKTEEAYETFNELPEWFYQVLFTGGSGLVSGGRTSETTIYLEPGYYVMECYIKMASGQFHSAMGMVKELIVLEEQTDTEPPEADINLTISSTEGINYNKEIVKGEHTISVLFRDQIVHENFVGHDVNLVRLDENADVEELEKWMNWADPKGLITPSPKGVTFLGGVNEMPAGSTGYFKASFESGSYAFISEVPDSRKKNMLATFEVGEIDVAAD